MKFSVSLLLTLIAAVTANEGLEVDDGEAVYVKLKATFQRKDLSGNTVGGSLLSVACERDLASSKICQNFDTDIVDLVNQQINKEFEASYYYMGLSSFFSRDDVALNGFAKFFKKASDEEREHGMKLMDYLNRRGAQVRLHNIKHPTHFRNDNMDGLKAVNEALKLEKLVNQYLLTLHKKAQDVNDPHLTDFLESHYLEEQVESIKQLGDFSTKLRRLTSGTDSEGVGIHMFDKELESM
ncbi:ferritin, heavy subunit isoform X1 [Lingula anatina]|uniref:Ferritin n=1 Tax=Lingula anatina TaxID=7574 RepID=A0A1S3ID92_LINAN|nr:ferritin, heavy subunit isoform X1 [Lingula anatina]|eukprot:XP_013396207.1 ferritin, heavy subunit isoform X1 [Lingula anatina]